MATLTYELKIDASPAVEELNKKAFKVFQVAANYILKHEISCAEAIYQRDKIWETAPELVEQLANIIGYWIDENEEDE